MIDQNLLRLVVEAGQVERGDAVIEVGPGTGTLTEELLSRGAEVWAVEIDRELATLLREKFAGQAAFQLIEADALAAKHALNPALLELIGRLGRENRVVRLVANLPYNIASPLVIELLIARVSLLAFTVQKEVAQRLRAAAGTEEYGAISVMAQLLSRVELLRTLPRQAFWPAPKVESCIVRMSLEDRLGASARNFGQFVQGIFASRRKTLRNAVANLGIDPEGVLAAVGLEGRPRPEELAPEAFLGLYHAAVSAGWGS